MGFGIGIGISPLLTDLSSGKGGIPPSNLIAPALSGTAQEGQTLTCSTGTWTGSPTYTYQWKRNGNNITSATNSTYTLVTADVGQSIKCTVTATNILGSASADSNTVTPTASTDADAQAFITAAGITDNTQKSAINTLVVDLKGYSIWTKFKAIYPIVGGSASSHAVNLKTPGAYNLTFATGWTHSSTGMTPNGATYADTGLNINTVMSLNSMAFGVYLRTDTSAGNKAHGAEAAGQYTIILEKYTGNTASGYINDNGSTGVSVANADSRGFFQASRTASNALRIVKNTTHATSTAASNSKPNLKFFFGASAINLSGGYVRPNDRQIAFGYLADGFTQTECDNLYTAVQAFQTTLNRNV